MFGEKKKKTIKPRAFFFLTSWCCMQLSEARYFIFVLRFAICVGLVLSRASRL